MTLEDLKHKRIVVLGMGTNNKHLALYLKQHAIPFSVVEKWKAPAELTAHLQDVEVIFRTPGLPWLSEVIQKSQSRGVIVYSQTKLFFDLCPASIIGVTGTKGKGTTSTLVHRLLEAHGKKSWLAGNIGSDPFQFLDQTKNDHIVVLELSSFQTQDLHKSPHVAVVLKITPEHLDYHHDFEEYTAAKLQLVKFSTPSDFAVLNYDSEITRSFADKTQAQIIWNSTLQEVKQGCFVRDGTIFLNELEIMNVDEVGLLGEFNLQNVTAAIAAVSTATAIDPKKTRQVIADFGGLEHRLEFVAEVNGVKFYDDSFSTTPETAVAALTVFAQPIILIAGGSEKNSDYRSLGKQIAASQIKALIAIGITGPRIADAARVAGFNGKILNTYVSDMQTIVRTANEIAEKGDVVLLSPASASFDMFANYKHRGELFKKFVVNLQS